MPRSPPAMAAPPGATIFRAISKSMPTASNCCASWSISAATQCKRSKGRADGQVTLSARRTDEGAAIDISDNGTGIPEQVLKHLFEAFAGRGRVGGTGLGLAIARELARGHGGDVVMLRTGPEGTTFRITIPDTLKTV